MRVMHQAISDAAHLRRHARKEFFVESIYWVLTWACHRRCVHCYDERFRPYRGEALARVVAEGQAAYPQILAHLPDDMSFLEAPSGAAAPRRRSTTLILSGGELLLDGVREQLFYPTLEAIAARWGAAAPRVSIQTTGDLLTAPILEEMLRRGVGAIAIASIDDFHVGMARDKKFVFMGKIRAMMAQYGVTEVGLGGARDARLNAPAPVSRGAEGPTFLFFGAQPELWIGELWPRGRAWRNGLSQASYETNFCARWSGGKNFLNLGHAGAEVAIEPDGSVYPCCLKTKAALGSLVEERLEDIVESLKGNSVFEAINAGDPEAMGLERGWSRADFERASQVSDPTGRAFSNLCIGCDAFFEAELAGEIERIRQSRLERTRHVHAAS